MGRYLAVNIRLDSQDFPAGMVAALEKDPYFRLATIGGIEGHASGDHWFLSGYALEDFVLRFAARAPAKPASVEKIVARDGSNEKYLASVDEALRSRTSCSLLSPFEELNAAAQVTVLADCTLGEAEIHGAQRWFMDHVDAVLYFYGAFSLEAKPDRREQACWERAFRTAGTEPDQIGPPFVLIRAAKNPITDGHIDVSLSSWSTVWLKGADRLNGAVGSREAEENLRRLASLLDAVLQAEDRRVVSSDLRLEGKLFLAQEQYLRGSIREIAS